MTIKDILPWFTPSSTRQLATSQPSHPTRNNVAASVAARDESHVVVRPQETRTASNAAIELAQLAQRAPKERRSSAEWLQVPKAPPSQSPPTGQYPSQAPESSSTSIAQVAAPQAPVVEYLPTLAQNLPTPAANLVPAMGSTATSNSTTAIQPNARPWPKLDTRDMPHVDVPSEPIAPLQAWSAPQGSPQSPTLELESIDDVQPSIQPPALGAMQPTLSPPALPAASMNQPVAHHDSAESTGSSPSDVVTLSDPAMPMMFQYGGDGGAAASPLSRSQIFGRPGAVNSPVYIRPLSDPSQLISQVAAPQQVQMAPVPESYQGETIESLDLPSEMMEEAMPMAPGYVVAGDQPVFGALLRDLSGSCCNECSRLGKFLGMFRREPCSDGGMGAEYLASAPMFMDVATPLPNTLRIRLDTAYNVQSPDRAEYYYSSLVGTGDRIDYQDIRFQMELGGPRLSTATEVPIRVLDPVLGDNTAGLGDMNIAVKTVLVDGETWQITQLFRTILNTGAITHGLSSGHVRMEPGLLFRMAWDDDTYWHGQIKYRFPIGGDPIHSGQVLELGSAISHIGYETDQVAILPTFEVNSFFVLDGQQFPFGDMNGVPVDGEMITNLSPSMRIVMENGSDLGVLEFALGSSIAISSIRWHSYLMALETRITY